MMTQMIGSRGEIADDMDHTVYLGSVAPKPLKDEDILCVEG